MFPLARLPHMDILRSSPSGSHTRLCPDLRTRRIHQTGDSDHRVAQHQLESSLPYRLRTLPSHPPAPQTSSNHRRQW